MMKRFLIAVPLLAAGMAFAPQAAHAQWRGGWHGGPGGWYGGYGGWHGGYGGGWYHRGWGPGAGLAVGALAGLAVGGALAAGAYAAPPPPVVYAAPPPPPVIYQAPPTVVYQAPGYYPY